MTCGYLLKWLIMNMAQRQRILISDVLWEINSDDSFDGGMAAGSDNELGMISVYSCDSDRSLEDIIQQ